jgi:hypothetical protein
LFFVFHLPLSLNKGEFIVTDASSTHEVVLRRMVLVEAVFTLVATRSGNVKLTYSEAIISLRDSKLRLVSHTRVDNIRADYIGVLVLTRARKLL